MTGPAKQRGKMRVSPPLPLAAMERRLERRPRTPPRASGVSSKRYAASLLGAAYSTTSADDSVAAAALWPLAVPDAEVDGVCTDVKRHEHKCGAG